MNQQNKDKIMDVIAQLEKFRFCGPSDDPDEQTSVIFGFSYLVKSFKYVASKVDDDFLRSKVEEINTNITDIYSAYDLNSDITPLMQDIKDYITDSKYKNHISNDFYISKSIISSLSEINSDDYDLRKLIQICNEINNNYQNGNYISVSLLIRGLINYIPPIFGCSTFIQVISNSPRSVKELLKPLEDNLRDIADFHTHNLIRRRDELPTKNQLEPYKANLEILLQEIMSKLSH